MNRAGIEAFKGLIEATSLELSCGQQSFATTNLSAFSCPDVVLWVHVIHA
jgi:hypothetical protein